MPEYCNSLCTFWCTEHDSFPYPKVETWAEFAAWAEIEINKAIDPIIEQAAIELGWRAGQSAAEIEKALAEYF